MSHEEIFGGTEYVNFVEEVDREGLLGSSLDYVLGKQKKEKTEKVDKLGMPIRTFIAYMELLQEHQEEKEKEQKKARMKQSVNSTTFG